MAKSNTIQIKLVSSANTGYFYVKKTTSITEGHAMILQRGSQTNAAIFTT